MGRYETFVSVVSVVLRHIYNQWSLHVWSQMYERIEKGWLAGNILNMGLVTVSIVIALKYTGNRPLMGRILERLGRPSIQLREEDEV